MTREQELELAISCLHYLTDEDKKAAEKNLGKLTKQLVIEDIKAGFPQYDKEWLEKDISVFAGTLRSDNHFGIIKAVSSHYKNVWIEMKFRIKETIIKDSRNTIYNLETKCDGEVDNYFLVKDGTGYIREALDTDRDFIKRYKEPKSPTLNQSAEEIISNTVDETLSQLKDLSSTAFAIRKLIKDNNCCLKVIDGKVYLQHLNYLTLLN